MPLVVMVTRLMEGTKVLIFLLYHYIIIYTYVCVCVIFVGPSTFTQRKCEQYYPGVAGEILTFGPYTLKTRKVSHFVDFEVRTIEISSEVWCVLDVLCRPQSRSLSTVHYRDLVVYMHLTTTCSLDGLTMASRSTQHLFSVCCIMSGSVGPLKFQL